MNLLNWISANPGAGFLVLIAALIVIRWTMQMVVCIAQKRPLPPLDVNHEEKEG